MRHDTPPLVELEGADDDRLDPSLDPIIIRTSQDFESSDDDTDLISDVIRRYAGTVFFGFGFGFGFGFLNYFPGFLIFCPGFCSK